MADQDEQLGRSISRGAAWMVLMRLSIRGLGFINMMVLFRILVPEDFGLMASAMVVIGFVEVLGEFGFDLTLIQKQKATRKHYDTVWTLSIMRGVVVALLLAALAAPTAAFFGDERITAIIFVLGAVSLLTGFDNPGTVNFRKDMNFRREFFFLVLPRIVAFVVTLTLGFLWRDYWALVGGIVVLRVMRVTLGYIMSPYRPRFSLEEWRDIINFSKWLQLSNIIVYVGYQIDYVLIQRYLGAYTLGLYRISREIADLTTTELVWPLERALYPGYSKISHDLKALRETFVNSSGLISLVVLPFSIGIILIADPAITLLLGAKGEGAIPFVQVLAVHGTFRILGASAGPVYLAMNRPRLTTAISLTYALSRLAFLSVAVPLAGGMGAAWAVAASGLVSLAINLVMVSRMLQLGPWVLLAQFWRVVAALGLMAVAVLLLKDYWTGAFGDAMPFVLAPLAVVVGAATYSASVVGLWFICGRPASSERLALESIRGFISSRWKACVA
jgi:O-antigen/teichoic acid export membrane protein